MKAYAEIKDYRRSVGLILTRPDPAGAPNLIQMFALSDNPETRSLFSIEHQAHWTGPFADRNTFTGMENIYLPIDEVQLIFDALWDAGMRPTNER